MAIAPKITFQVADEDSDKASTAVHVPAGLTVAQYGTFANDYANAIDDIVIGAVEPKAVMTVPVDISGLVLNIIDPNSDVEQITAFQFVADDGEPVDINVPGLLLANVIAGTDNIDTAATAIAAFITLIQVGNGVVIPTSVSEANITDLNYARKETRASGRKRN